MSKPSAPHPQASAIPADKREIAAMLSNYGLALRQTAEMRSRELEAQAKALRAEHRAEHTDHIENHHWLPVDPSTNPADKRTVVAMLGAYAEGLRAAGNVEAAAWAGVQAEALEAERQADLVRRFAGRQAHQ